MPLFMVHKSYLKTKIHKNLNISVSAPLYAAHIQKIVFDSNTFTENLVPLTGNYDSH